MRRILTESLLSWWELTHLWIALVIALVWITHLLTISHLLIHRHMLSVSHLLSLSHLLLNVALNIDQQHSHILTILVTVFIVTEHMLNSSNSISNLSKHTRFVNLNLLSRKWLLHNSLNWKWTSTNQIISTWVWVFDSELYVGIIWVQIESHLFVPIWMFSLTFSNSSSVLLTSMFHNNVRIHLGDEVMVF